MIRTFLASPLLSSALVISLINPAAAGTLTLKCSFDGAFSQEVVYVINDTVREVTVIGDFGSHAAKLVNFPDNNFYYILEPDKGASVSTLIYAQAGETPVGIRSTMGLLTPDKYQGIPDSFKLQGDNLLFMALSLKGRCPVQR